MKSISRRKFLNTVGSIGAAIVAGEALADTSGSKGYRSVPVYGHLWVYASRFPPDWDCTPILGQVFDDFAYAGIEGVEVMEVLLRNPDILSIGRELIEQHGIPVVGSSFYGDMWRRDQRQRILEDAELILGRLRQLGGSILGITVGDAGRRKTEEELDVQAETLQAVMRICDKNGIEPNIHNHTFEVEREMHDLKGILSRVPEAKLGPDVSWLARAGVDPVEFIREFGSRIVYVHLRDNAADGKFAEAVGDGVIDFPGIAQALKDVGFAGKAAIELAYDLPPERPAAENWELSRQYVQDVFGW